MTDDAVMPRLDVSRAHRDRARLPDLERGGIRWSVAWNLKAARPVDGTGGVLVLYDQNQPFVIGVDVNRGRPRWQYKVSRGFVPVAVRATEHHVVICAFPDNRSRHKYSISHGRVPPLNLTAPPAVTVSIHDRATGEKVWSHRWARPETDGIQAAGRAVTVAGTVVITEEADQLRARRITDGVQLWSQPCPSLSTWPAEPKPEVGIPTGFRGRQARLGWAWRQDLHGWGTGGTATSNDTFVESETGKVLCLVNVFHVSQDGLALTRGHDELACVSLPTTGR